MSYLKVKIETLVFSVTLGGKKATATFGVAKSLTISSDPTKMWGSEFSREFFILSEGKPLKG